MDRIAMIGLGAMGTPIARNLMRAGYAVTVWNRSRERMDALVAEGAHAATTVAEAFQAPVVFSMLADDRAVQETLLDPAVLDAAAPGAVHVNLATVSPGLARRAADAHAARGLGYVAAPVFGRVPVAEAGALNVLAAGAPELIARVQPMLDVIGARTWPMGERAEQANTVKILGNYLIACALQALGEAVSVAEHAGLDAGALVDLLSHTLFPGPVYGGYGALMADRSYQPAGFTTILGRKDLHLALDSAQEHGITLPVGELLRTVFDDAIANGHGADDWGSIAEQQPRPPQTR